MSIEGKIAWIGLGRMGTPMVRHLMNRVRHLWLYDRKIEAAVGVATGAAVVASSLTDCLDGASFVFTSLPNDTAVEQVLLGDEASIARCSGAILVETSTISHRLSLRLAEACALHGVEYIRLPVSGDPAMAAQGRLSAFASGPDEAWRRAQPIVSLFSASQTYMGSADEARYMKLVLNCLVANLAPLMAEALALGRHGGLDWKLMLAAIGASPLCSPWLSLKLNALATRDFTATFPPYMIMKDLDLMLDAAREAGVTMPMTAATRQTMQGMCTEPFREEDFFAVVKVVERNSGLADISP